MTQPSPASYPIPPPPIQSNPILCRTVLCSVLLMRCALPIPPISNTLPSHPYLIQSNPKYLRVFTSSLEATAQKTNDQIQKGTNQKKGLRVFFKIVWYVLIT